MSWPRHDHSSPRSVSFHSSPDARAMPPVHKTLRNPHADDGGDEDHEASRISAYARLDFDNYTFFVQTLQVVLGRELHEELLLLAHHTVDVHLSQKKAISRRHAKIFYNFGTQRFEISVLGRNGAFVDDLFVEKGITVPLVDGTKIQIGDIPFAFVLPSIELSDSDDKRAGVTPFNPSDAINLRTNMYLALPARRRNSKADLVRRLSIARSKPLASATSDEISALLKELETIDAEEESPFDPALLDKSPKKEDDLDVLLQQHIAPDKHDKKLDMDISMLDQEIATLAPLIEHSADLHPKPKDDRPLMGKVAPMMGKPATIQPPANRVYGRLPAPYAGTYAPLYSYTGYQTTSLYMPGPPPPKLDVAVAPITAVPTVRPLVKYRAITVDVDYTERPSVCVFKSVEPVSSAPKLPRRKDAARRPARPQPLKDVPEQFKIKPSVSVVSMVLTVLRSGTRESYTMNDIYDGIRELFPYFSYCQDGWQFPVLHSVRFNKMFAAVAKSGPEADWRWAIDDKYLEEKDRVRKKQQEAAMARAKDAAMRAVDYRLRPSALPLPVGPYAQRFLAAENAPKQKSIAELASEIKRDPPAYAYSKTTPVYFQRLTLYEDAGNIKEQLAANRLRSASQTATPAPPAARPEREALASPSPLPAMNADTKKSLTYLQKELFTLYKARKLSYNTTVTTEIITKALATTISQVNIIGAKAGCKDNALSFLVEKAPQQVSKILDIALTKSIKERQGESAPSSRPLTPQPEPKAELPRPAPGKPSYAGLARPTFSGPKLQGSPKPGALAKPPQFLSNKKRPAEEESGASKAVKLD